MAIPSITFPIEQSKIKQHRDMLMATLKGLQADIQVIHTMLTAMQSFCDHLNNTNKDYECIIRMRF